MPKAIGPRKIGKYPLEFKTKAVALSQIPGIEVQQVAESLGIHPYMLSRWRKEVREGRWVAAEAIGLDAKQVAELQQLRKLKREYALLQEEHELLKKAIRFCSERKLIGTPSSNRTGRHTQ